MRTHTASLRLTVATATAVAAIFTTACSRVVPVRLAGDMAHVWVAADPAAAVMIQVTRQDDALSGTLDETRLKSSDAMMVTPMHAAFTGTIDGTALTLSFPAGLGFVTNISGTLSGDTMTLQSPQDDGSVASLTLKPGSIDTYNQGASAVQASAQANADANTAAAASAADAKQQQDSQAGIRDAADRVARDVAALQPALNPGPDFSAFDSDLAAARTDLATAKTDAARAATESDEGSACSDASSAASDAASVESDAASIDSDTASVDSEIDSVNTAARGLQQSLSAYQQSAAAMPGYTPTNAPNARAIQTLLDKTTKQAGAWKAKAAQYQGQVAQLVTQANAIATKAQNQYC